MADHKLLCHNKHIINDLYSWFEKINNHDKIYMPQDIYMSSYSEDRYMGIDDFMESFFSYEEIANMNSSANILAEIIRH